MSTLRQLLETVGTAVVDVVAAPRGLDLEIRDVLVHDRSDELEIGRGDLVLGIGLNPGAEVVELVQQLGTRSAAGVAVKSHVLDGDVSDAAWRTDLALVSVNKGTSWAQVLALMQSALTHGGFHIRGEKLAGLEAGDLFALADAAGALVDAPVTIEDRLSRVLAYSRGQERADAARAETVMGRKVPERFVKRFEKEGLFRRLGRSDGSIYLDDIEEDVLPRLVVPVRAGAELLGSMWAACRGKPSDKQVAAFEDAAKIAALHLLRLRAGADIERRLEADLLAAALHGGGAARDAIARLGMRGDSFVVLALWVDSEDRTAAESVQIELRDLLSVQMEALRLNGSVAPLGGVVYALLETSPLGANLSGVQRLGREVAARCRSTVGVSPHVGVGSLARGVSDIPRSKREADAALKVLRAGRCEPPIATIEEVRVQALLLRFGEVASDDTDLYETKVRVLAETDARKGTRYVETLRAFLETFGDVALASERLLVHPNTFRYRLRRIQEISGVKLDDANERLALMILLSVFLQGESVTG